MSLFKLQFGATHFFAGTLAKCSRHFVVNADDEAPSSYVTYFGTYAEFGPTSVLPL